MDKRIKILTAGCVLASIALILTQYFYLRNTYSLYQKTALSEIKEELSLMEKKINVDSLRKAWMKNIESRVLAGSKVELRNYVKRSTDSFLVNKLNHYINGNKVLTSHSVKYATIYWKFFSGLTIMRKHRL